MVTALSIISFFVLIIAIRAWFVRKEIAKILSEYNVKRKKIKEEAERRRKKHIMYRGIAIYRKLNSLTADDLRDPKKIEKAIKEAC